MAFYPFAVPTPGLSPSPDWSGLVAWTVDPAANSGTAAPVNGTLYLMGIKADATVPASALWWIITTAGVGPVAGQNWATFYSSAGVLLASVNIDAAVTGINGQQSVMPSATVFQAGNWYYTGLLFNAATPPVLSRTQQANGNISQAGPLFTPGPWRQAIGGTLLTAPPASITPVRSGNLGIIAGVS